MLPLPKTDWASVAEREKSCHPWRVVWIQVGHLTYLLIDRINCVISLVDLTKV